MSSIPSALPGVVVETARGPGVKAVAAGQPDFLTALGDALQELAGAAGEAANGGDPGTTKIQDPLPSEPAGGKSPPEIAIDWAIIAAQVVATQQPAPPVQANGATGIQNDPAVAAATTGPAIGQIAGPASDGHQIPANAAGPVIARPDVTIDSQATAAPVPERQDLNIQAPVPVRVPSAMPVAAGASTAPVAQASGPTVQAAPANPAPAHDVVFAQATAPANELPGTQSDAGNVTGSQPATAADLVEPPAAEQADPTARIETPAPQTSPTVSTGENLTVASRQSQAGTSEGVTQVKAPRAEVTPDTVYGPERLVAAPNPGANTTMPVKTDESDSRAIAQTAVPADQSTKRQDVRPGPGMTGAGLPEPTTEATRPADMRSQDLAAADRPGTNEQSQGQVTIGQPARAMPEPVGAPAAGKEPDGKVASLAASGAQKATIPGAGRPAAAPDVSGRNEATQDQQGQTAPASRTAGQKPQPSPVGENLPATARVATKASTQPAAAVQKAWPGALYGSEKAGAGGQLRFRPTAATAPQSLWNTEPAAMAQKPASLMEASRAQVDTPATTSGQVHAMAGQQETPGTAPEPAAVAGMPGITEAVMDMPGPVEAVTEGPTTARKSELAGTSGEKKDEPARQIPTVQGNERSGPAATKRNSTESHAGPGDGRQAQPGGSRPGTTTQSQFETVVATAASTGAAKSEAPGEHVVGLAVTDATGAKTAGAVTDEAMPRDVSQALINRLTQAIRRGERECRLELYPEALGHVQARISFAGDKLSLYLGVQTLQAQETVSGALPELRQALADRGIPVAQCNVGFSADGKASGHAQYQPQGHAGSNVTPGRPGALHEVTHVPAPRASPVRARGLVDVMI